MGEVVVRQGNWVGISLMVSEETEAAVDMIRQEFPDATIDFRDCFYKIERDGHLAFDMDELSERVGRDVPTTIFLVNMSSYYGRINVSDSTVELFPEAAPEALKVR
jgi:propane monooxygenase coupling protein